MNVGTSWTSNPRHFGRIVYGNNFKNVQNEAQATKQVIVSQI